MTSLMLRSFHRTTHRSIHLLGRSTPRITPFKLIHSSSLKLPLASPISTLLNFQPWTLSGNIGSSGYRLFHTKNSGVEYTSASTRIAKETKHTKDNNNNSNKTSSGSSSRWPEARRLFALARPEARLLGGAIALLFVSSAVSMSVPFSMGKIIDIVTNPTAALPGNLTLTQFYSLLGGVFLAGAVANTGRVTLMKLVGERIVARLRTNLFDTFLKQDVAFFDRTRSGELISRLSVDTSIVGKTLSNNISDGLRNIVMSVGGLSMMAYVSGKLTLCMMFIVPPMAVAVVYYGRYVRNLSKKTQSALGEVTKVAEERLGNIRTVFAFAREGDESKRYSNRVNEVFSLAKKEAFASGIFFGTAGFTGNLTVLAVLALGGSMVSQGQISVGELASFLMYTVYVGSSTMGVTSFYSEMMKGLGAGSRLFELLDRVPAINKDGGICLPIVHGGITFNNVHFTYPTRPGIQVLNGLSFTIKPGTSIAVAGTSGSGKSTIGSLILRFYDPTRGQVLIDGTDIRELNAKWWRGYVGVVSQEPVLFAGTLADNIRYANLEATTAQVEAAARMANCEFIQWLPEQFDTFVGERGVSLSGGQKQRVAIARALLKNPRVLILDEATSALDAESEYLVQDALDRISRNRTVITIAHRASTLQRSDLVLCLDGGQAVEMGSYTELMAARGTFWRIMERQRTATIDKDNEGENDDNHDNNDSDGDDDAIKSDIFGQQTEQLLSRKR